ncbi:pilS cassette, partial [Neisseria gonorrhoeae]
MLRLRIPVFAGIRFFEFQSFLINSCSFEFLDSRFCGNGGLEVT